MKEQLQEMGYIPVDTFSIDPPTEGEKKAIFKYRSLKASHDQRKRYEDEFLKNTEKSRIPVSERSLENLDVDAESLLSTADFKLGLGYNKFALEIYKFILHARGDQPVDNDYRPSEETLRQVSELYAAFNLITDNLSISNSSKLELYCTAIAAHTIGDFQLSLDKVKYIFECIFNDALTPETVQGLDDDLKQRLEEIKNSDLSKDDDDQPELVLEPLQELRKTEIYIDWLKEEIESEENKVKEYKDQREQRKNEMVKMKLEHFIDQHPEIDGLDELVDILGFMQPPTEQDGAI